MRLWVAAVVASAALTGCGSDAKPQSQQTPTPDATSATPSAGASLTVPPTSTTPAVVVTKQPPIRVTDLEDGRHYAYLKSLDTASRALGVDVIQFLTGEAAEKAAAEDGEEAYDYYIRNQNKKVRTLSLAPNVRVVVNTLTASETGSSSKDTEITLAKLKSYFDKGEAQRRVFYVTLAGGRVTRINEQYLP